MTVPGWETQFYGVAAWKRAGDFLAIFNVLANVGCTCKLAGLPIFNYGMKFSYLLPLMVGLVLTALWIAIGVIEKTYGTPWVQTQRALQWEFVFFLLIAFASFFAARILRLGGGRRRVLVHIAIAMLQTGVWFLASMPVVILVMSALGFSL